MITDAVLITLYGALAVMVTTTTVSFAMHGIHQQLSSTYYWISVCVIGWLLIAIAYYIVKDVQMIEYLNNLAFPFIAFLPVFLLRFTLRFYHGGGGVRKRAYLLLLVIPAITSVISVVPSLNWLMRSGYEVVQLTPLHIVDYTWNIWFFVHAAYCYILFAICCAVAIRQYRKKPREYRIPSILLIGGMGIAYLSDLFSINYPNTVIDNTLIGICLSMVALYFAVVNNPAVAFLTNARKALYNNMDLPVFILNQQGYILDVNPAARGLMGMLGTQADEIRSMTFGDVYRVVFDFGGAVKEGFAKDMLPHIFLPLHGEKVVYKQVRRELVNKKGKFLGSYIALIDITGLRETVDDLQQKAEIDMLTGIPNRRAFEQRVAELDRPEKLPLSFIVGDVNRLKQVNDELGHEQGDRLLKSIADALTAACPENGIAARVGGDEFILVLPHCDTGRAQGVVQAIHAGLMRMEGQFLGASIALGYITKCHPDQDVQSLIREADRLMYTQKKYDRRKRVV